jgi:hypothetical protein
MAADVIMSRVPIEFFVTTDLMLTIVPILVGVLHGINLHSVPSTTGLPDRWETIDGRRNELRKDMRRP